MHVSNLGLFQEVQLRAIQSGPYYVTIPLFLQHFDLPQISIHRDQMDGVTDLKFN